MKMKGWMQVHSSRFVHFFKDGASLCMKYFETPETISLEEGKAYDFCASCTKKLTEVV